MHNIKLFLVDDDAVFLKALEIEFTENANFQVETFATGEACVNALGNKPDIIILDYHLNGITPSAINGIETLDQINATNSAITTIMLSSQDSIDVAIKCMHHQAYDYIVKSETAFLRLKESISRALHSKKLEKQLNWYMNKM